VEHWTVTVTKSIIYVDSAEDIKKFKVLRRR